MMESDPGRSMCAMSPVCQVISISVHTKVAHHVCNVDDREGHRLLGDLTWVTRSHSGVPWGVNANDQPFPPTVLYSPLC
jgi:hypothetical protein